MPGESESGDLVDLLDPVEVLSNFLHSFNRIPMNTKYDASGEKR